jgi:hypothetical protein
MVLTLDGKEYKVPKSTLVLQRAVLLRVETVLRPKPTSVHLLFRRLSCLIIALTFPRFHQPAPIGPLAALRVS